MMKRTVEHYIPSNVLSRVLKDTWTVQDLAERFRVTVMTIHNWRVQRDLPALTIPGRGRPALRFVPKEVREWAKNNDIPMYELRQAPLLSPPLRREPVVERRAS